MAVDLLVVGGGVAGVAAALTGARRGLRVLLLEREQVLGGTAVLGMTGTICGLYRNGGSGPGEPLHDGLTAEIAAALRGLHPGRDVKRVGRVYVLPYSRRDLQELLEALCCKEERLTVRHGAFPLAIAAERGSVTVATVASTQGIFTVMPAAVVDATGNGDAACLAGAEFELSSAELRQLGGYTIKVSGLVAVSDSLSIRVPFAVAKAIESGELPAFYRYTVFAAGEQESEGFLKINLQADPEAGDAEDPIDADALVGLLGRTLPEFGQAVIMATSGRCFPREGRRVIGSYMLTAADVLSARKFPDGVVRGAWPMEIWSRDRGVSYRYPPDGDYYEIPARCFKARGFSNFFMAGRCISVSSEALGSTRVIATCIALGEQAAVAAVNCISPSGHL